MTVAVGTFSNLHLVFEPLLQCVAILVHHRLRHGAKFPVPVLKIKYKITIIIIIINVSQ